MSAVVVRARFDSRTFDSEGSLSLKKGDMGVLKWVPHKRHQRFLEPQVIWDRDPERRPRKTILSSMSIVGLQKGNIRVLLETHL